MDQNFNIIDIDLPLVQPSRKSANEKFHNMTQTMKLLSRNESKKVKVRPVIDTARNEHGTNTSKRENHFMNDFEEYQSRMEYAAPSFPLKPTVSSPFSYKSFLQSEDNNPHQIEMDISNLDFSPDFRQKFTI